MELRFGVVGSHIDFGLVGTTLENIGGAGARNHGHVAEGHVTLANLCVEHVDGIELGIHHFGSETRQGDQGSTCDDLVEIEHLPGL